MKQANQEVHVAPWEAAFRRVLSPMQHFIHHQTAASGLLILCTVIALLIANSTWNEHFQHFLHLPVALQFGSWRFELSLLHVINEAMMAIFFLFVGLELKRELLVGQLADLKRACLPVAAALGGIVVPALIYYSLNPSAPQSYGWGVPMATDIAFAVAALGLLSGRIPAACASFLVALAIADDLAAVLVIAVFYTEQINLEALMYCVALCGVLLALNLGGIRTTIPYLAVGVFLWFAMLASGVHATIAGVLLAFFIPMQPKFDVQYFIRRVRNIADDMENDAREDAKIVNSENLRSRIWALDTGVSLAQAPAQRLEHKLHIPVAFIVLPLFALGNACVPIDFAHLGEVLNHSVTLGVIAGLVLGKWMGVAGATWLMVKLKLATLPDQVTMRHIHGLAMLAGIGFTMSIFVADLAFARAPELLLQAKTGILFASLIAGVAGYCWLRFACGKPTHQE